MKKDKKLSDIFDIYQIIIKYEPLYFIFSLLQILTSPLLTFLTVYFPKKFIEQLTCGTSYTRILSGILIYICLLLIINIINIYFSKKCSLYGDRFSGKIKLKIGTLTMSVPLEYIEGAHFSDKLSLSGNVAQILNSVNMFQDILSNIITITGLAAIVMRLDVMFVLLVCLTLSIKMLFVRLNYIHNKKRRLEYAANDRRGNYLNNIVYFNQGAAKELRINNLSGWIMKKVKGYRDEMLSLQYGDFRRYAIFESISAVIMSLQSFVILSILSFRVIDKSISIADFTMYFTAVTTLSSAMSSIIVSVGEYNRQQLNLSDYKSLIKNTDIDRKYVSQKLSDYDIVFENVSFKYPNTNTDILKNINLRINFGEKLSVVGKNGSGKSTFVKLLCRFYRPTSGRITVGGIDIWELSQNEYIELMSAVFQDYQNFYFTLGENITMNKENGNINEIVKDMGLDDFIKKLPDGLDTYLTKNFDESGVELSGGEGQKFAIARAVYKNSPILILDEPTASLDAKAESEIFDSFIKASKGKTTIFVSHRMASSAAADKIVFFKDGEITEYGSHRELIDNHKDYEEMFNMQAELYI